MSHLFLFATPGNWLRRVIGGPGQGFAEEESMPDFLHLFQPTNFLQLPLMVKEERVTEWPPARQILLTPHIGIRGVENSTDPTLNAWNMELYS